jgi:uncharacterized protein HemY
LAKKTVTLAEKSASATERILFYHTFGDILLSVNELPDAIQYLKIALKEAKASKNREVMASVMNHVANAVGVCKV